MSLYEGTNSGALPSVHVALPAVTGQLPPVGYDIFPIFKKGSVRDAAIYSPMSLSCVPCKLLEHIPCSHVHAHLSKDSTLMQLDYGFCKSHSCVNSTGPDSMEGKTLCFDKVKVFDKVPHQRLNNRLHIYRSHGEKATWIGALLDDRIQQVVVDGSHSDPSPVK